MTAATEAPKDGRTAAPARPVKSAGFFLPVYTLWNREMVRFYRDKGRVIGALTPPIVFWFLIGSGLGNAFHVPGTDPSTDFLRYFFAGTLVLIVLFTSIFSTISIIEDRREGFLQSVLVAPVPRLAVVLGKILGASTVGFLQGASFLVFARAVGFHPGAAGYLQALAALALASVGLTGIGFCLAWKLDSTQGFHAVMNLFLIPMWMLSGALFPVATASRWLQVVIRLNPTTYAVMALQQALLPGEPAWRALGGPTFCFSVLAAFVAAMAGLSVWIASER